MAGLLPLCKEPEVPRAGPKSRVQVRALCPLQALHRQPTTPTAQPHLTLPLLSDTLPSERFAGLKPCGREGWLASPTWGLPARCRGAGPTSARPARTQRWFGRGRDEDIHQGLLIYQRPASHAHHAQTARWVLGHSSQRLRLQLLAGLVMSRPSTAAPQRRARHTEGHQAEG